MNLNYKKAAFTIISLLLLKFAYPFQKNGDGYIINGTIEGMDTGKIYLIHYNDNTAVTDSTTIADGHFTFKGKATEPMFYFLRIAELNTGVGLFVENTTITVQGHKDNFNKAVISASPSQIVYKKWSLAWSGITADAGKIYRTIDSVTQQGKEKMDSVTRLWVDKEFEKLTVRTDEAVEKLVAEYPNSPVIPFIIQDRYINYPAPEKVDKYYALLGEEARNSIYGKQVAKSIEVGAKTAIGASPDFTLQDVNGKSVTIASLRGRYVLVDFWASWCGPCRKENPNVVKAYQRFHDKGFTIVGVSLDTKKDAWLKAIEKDTLTWTHVSDLKGWESEVVKEYGITAVPTNFLLDKEGKVIAKNLREEALQKKLEEIFNVE